MAFLSAYFRIQASYKSRLAFPLCRELVRLNGVHYGAVAAPPIPLGTKALPLTGAQPGGADFHGNLRVSFERRGTSL